MQIAFFEVKNFNVYFVPQISLIKKYFCKDKWKKALLFKYILGICHG